ncbi:hypothetical protein D9M71_757180 [compost metagenome]
MFELEAFHGQVDAIGEAGILGFGFEFKLQLDLLHQFAQLCAFGFRQWRILFQLLAQGIELFLQFAGRHGVLPSFIDRHWHRPWRQAKGRWLTFRLIHSRPTCMISIRAFRP